MRGLVDEEREALEHLAAPGPGVLITDEQVPLRRALAARGLLDEWHEEDDRNHYTYWVITPLGRLLLAATRELPT